MVKPMLYKHKDIGTISTFLQVGLVQWGRGTCLKCWRRATSQTVHWCDSEFMAIPHIQELPTSCISV